MVAALGGYLSATSNYYQANHPRVPREPIAKWSLKLTVDGSGKMVPDVPGLLEFVSYAPVVCVGPWFMANSSGPARLVCLAAAVAWVGSCLNAVFVDPAFYNPQAPDKPWQRGLAAVGDHARSAVLGPVAASIALAVVLPAPWTPDEKQLAAAVCCALFAVQLRIRETDRLLLVGAETSREREIDARRVMAGAVHDGIGTPLAVIQSKVRRTPALREALGDMFAEVEAGYDDVLGLELEVDRDIEWPGLIMTYLNGLERMHLIDFDLKHPNDLARPDRIIAHGVIHNLAANAARAGAARCSFELQRTPTHLSLRATDDAPPFPDNTFLIAGGGLSRVHASLKRTGPGSGLRLLSSGASSPKLIEATWVSRSAETAPATTAPAKGRDRDDPSTPR